MCSGSAKVVQGYCSALQELGHEVHLAYHPIMSGDVQAMKKVWGDRFHLVRYTHPAVAGSLRAKASYRLRQLGKQWFLSRGNPNRYNYRLDEWYDERLGQEVLALQRQHRFAAIFINYVFLSKAFTALEAEPVIKVLVAHDRFADRNFKVALTRNANLWFSCSPKDEAKGLERADKITAVEESEVENFKSVATKPVSLVTPIFPVNVLHLPPSAANTLLFVGSDIAINRDGIIWFIQEVLPALRSVNPLIELKIAGRVCNMIKADHPGVTNLGEVKVLDDTYRMAAIVINPVKTGTGLCIKSLEALSYGRPLVSSPAGARGLKAALYHGLFIANNKDEFVEQIFKLIESAVYYQSQSKAARIFVESWNEEVRKNISEILK